MVLICANDPPAEAGFLFLAFSKVCACVADINVGGTAPPFVLPDRTWVPRPTKVGRGGAAKPRRRGGLRLQRKTPLRPLRGHLSPRFARGEEPKSCPVGQRGREGSRRFP